MIVEKIVIDAITAEIGIPAYLGMQPQGTDEAPSAMPVAIVNRTLAEWANCFTGPDQQLALTNLQIDWYAETAEAARRYADEGRALLPSLSDPDGADLAPTLQSEQSFYDQLSRAWRVMQAWNFTDYAPALA